MDCPDLSELAGEKFRWVTQQEWFEVTGNTKDTCRDPWYYEIPGRLGKIVPWGPGLLAMVIDGRPLKSKEAYNLSWVTQERSQLGDDGVNAVFEVKHFKLATKFLKSHKAREYTPEQREELRQRMLRIRALDNNPPAR
jgi:hypothetical protein